MTEPWKQTIEIDENIARLAIEHICHLTVNKIHTLNAGWDNIVFEVNDDLIFRFPRREFGLICMENEINLLPYIQDKLSYPISAPQWIGEPSSHYPYPFAGYQKLQGDAVCEAFHHLIDDKQFARTLAQFLKELHQVPINTDIPVKGEYDWKLNPIHRLKSIHYFEQYPEYFAKAGISKATIEKVTDKILGFKVDSANRCYVHGDLYSRHVLVEHQQPIGLIDFGDIHIGHPGIDFAVTLILEPSALNEFLNVYPYPDEETKNIMLMHGFCHGLAFFAYAYSEKNEYLMNWANLVLNRAIEMILNHTDG